MWSPMWSSMWHWGWQPGWHYKFLLKGVRALIALGTVVAGAWWLDQTAALIPLVLGVNASALAETDDSWRGRLRALLITLLCFAAMALAVQFTLHSKPALMAVLALARQWRSPQPDAVEARSARWAAAGALLFVASDSLLAWDRFAGGLPLASLLVLSTYYGAQYAIARSVK